MKFRIAKEIVYTHQTTNQSTHPTQPTVFSREFQEFKFGGFSRRVQSSSIVRNMRNIFSGNVVVGHNTHLGKECRTVLFGFKNLFMTRRAEEKEGYPPAS